MAGGLFRRWGLGVDLIFRAGRAAVEMTRTQRAANQLRRSFQRAGQGVQQFVGSFGQVGAVLSAAAAGFGLTIGKASQLAADLESQTLTMRTLLGDAGKAAELIAQIRREAASTPFAEGDLIEGSKRLLRLTGQNVDQNLELLRVMETMAALNPTKNVVDAVEALLDATSGGGFERLKEFGISFRAEDFEQFGRAGGAAWAEAVSAELGRRVNDVTRGADLVGELSRTFSGRLSTLKDAATNNLRELGAVFNREIGPALEPLTEALAGRGPQLRAAAEDLARIVRQLVTMIAPWVDRAVELWDRLGESMQRRIVMIGLAVGALLAVLAPVGAALGVVGFLVAGIVSGLAAAWPVISGVVGALGTLALPEVLGGLAAVAAAATLLFAIFSREGEGPIQTIMRIGQVIWGVLGQFIERTKIRIGAFLGGFREGFGGLAGPIGRTRDAFRPILDMAGEIWAVITGDGVNVQFWHMLGQVLGMVADRLVNGIASGLEVVASAMHVVWSIFRPFALAIWRFVGGLVGLVTGSKSAKDAIADMIVGISGVLVGLVSGVFSLLTGALEIILRTIAGLIRQIPGADRFLDASGSLGADALRGARTAFEGDISAAIAGIGRSGSARDAAASRASAPAVNVQPTTVDNQVQVEAVVQVDGQELARSVGQTNNRTDQRRGRNSPPQTRGLVLRHGRIEQLRAAEVL